MTPGGGTPTATDATPRDPAAAEPSPTRPAGAPPAGDRPGGGPGDRLPPRRLTATRLAACVLAVIAASVFAFLGFTRDDGVPRPDDAARRLFEAVVAGDAIAVLESLPPGEREVLVAPTLEAVDELRRLDLAVPFDARRVPGATVRTEGLQFRTTMLSDEVAAVDVVAGTFGGSTTPDRFPFSGRFRALLGDVFDIDVDDTSVAFSRDFAEDPLRLIATKQGGGWHISATYSLADAVRAQHDAPFPAFGEGLWAIGADTPETAVRDLVKAYADSDAERAVNLMNSREAAALYEYGSLFVPAAQRLGRQVDERHTFDAQLNALELQSEGTGGVRRVRISKLDVDIRDEVHKAHISYDGRCYDVDYRFADGDDPFERFHTCNGDARQRGSAVDRPRDDPFSALAVFGGGAELPTFTVVERNGRWFVSPVRTLADALVSTLRTATPDDIESLAELARPSLDAAIEGLRGRRTGVDEAGVGEAPAPERLLDACGAAVDRHDRRVRGGDGERRDALVATCLTRLVERGALDADAVPAALPPP